MSATPLPPRSYSVVITSCGRFDLLRRTIQSLQANLDIPPQAWVLIEDSGDESVRDVFRDLGIEADVIVNAERLGQMKSLDKVYAHVKTPYAFHCEDDWEFLRTGFMAESFALLEARPDYSIVCLRPRSEQNSLVRNAPNQSVAGVSVFEPDPAAHPEYFSYTFNPGLRRMDDYRRFGPYEALGHEPDVSYAFKKAGFRLVNLEQPAVRHIGDERHVHDPTQPVKAKTPWAKLKRSIGKRWKRLQRVFGG